MIEIAPRNRLLAALEVDDLKRLAPALKRTRLERGSVLCEAEEEVQQVWFPESCLICLTTVMREGDIVESATIGREGMAGLFAALGDRKSVARSIVQVPGYALQLPVNDLSAAFEASPRMRRLCLNYVQALGAHILQSAACAALHTVEARLCRWLLHVQDQAGDDATLALTQDFLAEMLGVQRTTVTLVARTLQAAKLITYRRGQITVLDRAGIEEAACECYEVICAHYDRLLSASRG
jgi:CRP-like cAMP-binding protein